MAQDRKTIDDITRTLETIAGTERFPLRDDTGDAKAVMSTFLTYVLNNVSVSNVGVIPVGGLTFYAGERADTPTLGDNFADQDGSVINDAESPYNGERNYNFNGGDVVLTLTWTADAGGAYATVSADDLYALNEGDDVTGSGIAADTKITDITGTTVTISDVSASGSISTTFTNDGLAVYGGSGGSQADQMQGHWHTYRYGRRDGGSTSGYDAMKQDYSVNNTIAKDRVIGIISDGTNGTPRTGTRTRSHARILKVAMRIK
jgi:hypothetical protein